MEDYEWAIPRRTRSQELLLEIYKYLNTNPDLGVRPRSRAIFGLLVGASFSLWRAAFLARPQRQWEGPSGIIEGARDLLEKLLDSNAILYGEEKKIEGWSEGYYLNNAYYRIESAIQRLPEHEEIEVLSRFLDQRGKGITSDSPRDIWDIGCEAAFAVLDVLYRYPEPTVTGVRAR